MIKNLKFLPVLLGALLLIVGCASETAAPTAPVIAKGTLTPHADAFMATIGDTSSTKYYVYTPPGYTAPRPGVSGYPVIYFLNGFGGNENYFVALFSATDAADLLLAEGKIEPMVLVFLSGHTVLGGSFYTNSGHPTVGNSEDHIGTVMAAVEGAYHVDVAKRGVAGHSMGGYGSFSYAMNHPGTFKTIAAMSAPLSFWGTRTSPPHDVMTYKGIEEVLPTVLRETGYDSILAQTGGAGSAAAYHQMFYPSPARRVTSMMFSMAAALSPTTAPGATTIDSVVVGFDGSGNPIKSAMYVDLPLGVDGQIDMPTWNRWMAKDVIARFAGGQAAALAGVKIYLDCGNADDLGLYGAHGVLAKVLVEAGMPPSVHTVYPGISDGAGGTTLADHTKQIFERVKSVLIWESAQF